MKSGISQQPLVGSYSNLKLKLWDQIRVYKGIKWRWPPMEDDHQRKTTSKYEKWNISANHCSDLTQIWNRSYWDQIRVYKGIKWKWPTMEDNHHRRTTSKYEKWNISTTTGRILLKFETEAMGSNQSVQRYQMKTTSSGRRPQNMESGISQQPLVRSYSNLKLELIWSNQSVQRYQMKMTSNGRWPPADDDLKIWQVEYLSNHWSDLTQIWNWSYGIKSECTKVLNEDDLQRKTTSKYGKWNISATTGRILLKFET